MSDESLSNRLLKAEGLTPSAAPDALIAEIRRIQDKADRCHRFWFRLSCIAWIVAAVSFIGGLGLLAVDRMGSVAAVTSPTPSSNPTTGYGYHADPMRVGASFLLGLLQVSAIAGIVSAIMLRRIKREGSNATMQATLESLVSEVETLRRNAKNDSPQGRG